MQEVTFPAKSFMRLFDYLQRIDADVAAVAAAAQINPQQLAKLPPDTALPVQQYSRLYSSSVRHLESLGISVPWSAGVGGEAFELVCHCMLSGGTLGGALALAQRFQTYGYPLSGHRIALLDDNTECTLVYEVEFDEAQSRLSPEDWDRFGYQQTVMQASGLMAWQALCGWLIGEPVEIERVEVAAPFVTEAYNAHLSSVFRCPITFYAQRNTIHFRSSLLQRPLVHTRASLHHFLENCIYELVALQRRPSSTSAAIKSLARIELPGAMPTINDIARSLNMSESSLRRRLQKEGTSFQQLKDELRCNMAEQRLLQTNARVADVAADLGFSDASSFARSFKNWTGHTPASYREMVVSLRDGS